MKDIEMVTKDISKQPQSLRTSRKQKKGKLPNIMRLI